MSGNGDDRGNYRAVPSNEGGYVARDSMSESAQGRSQRAVSLKNIDEGPGNDEEQNPEASPEDMSEFRKWVGEVFIEGNRFQSFIALIILGNAAVIGLETDVKEMTWLWNMFENTFLFIFVIELALRVFYLRSALCSGPQGHSNAFDATLVISGVVDYIVTQLLKGDLGTIGMIIKACRLLRILRLFRLFKMIKPLYMLASGFLESAGAVFWVSVLCGLGLYICAIFLTRTLGALEGKDNEIYALKFGTVLHSMFTLFELMSNPDLDSMEQIMLASPAMMMFFVTFIIYGSFAMLSILTGVISEGMIEKGNSHKEEMRFDEEKKKHIFMGKLRTHFELSDADGDGTMTREEFHDKLPEMITLFRSYGFYYDSADLQIVFDLVDFDKGGTVEVEEFLQGMTSFTANVSDLPLQFLRLQSNIMVHMNKMEELMLTKFAGIEVSQANLDAKLNMLNMKAPPPGQMRGGCW